MLQSDGVCFSQGMDKLVFLLVVLKYSIIKLLLFSHKTKQTLICSFSQLRSDSYDLAVDFITSQGQMYEAPGCPASQVLFHLLNSNLTDKQDVEVQCDLIKTDVSDSSQDTLVGLHQLILIRYVLIVHVLYLFIFYCFFF